VRSWVEAQPEEDLFISVIAITELRDGIERLRHRDSKQSQHLEVWLKRTEVYFGARALPVTADVADRAGRLFPAQPVPDFDRLIAATALEHNFDVVTRNTRDFERTGVTVINPWQT
jgi:predicted nucleic acid-binding protein